MPGETDQPTRDRTELNALIARLHETQRTATQRIQAAASFENLGDATPDGFTVNDTLRMWVWHFWSHQRDLVRAQLAALVAERPDATLAELRAALGVQVSLSAICTALKQLKLTYKKR